MRSREGSRVPPSRHAIKCPAHADAACSSPLLRSGSTPCAKSYSLENGTCAKVPALIKSSLTPAKREREREGKKAEGDPTSSPSSTLSPAGLGRSVLQCFASQQPLLDATEATMAEKSSKSLCVTAYTDLSVPRKKRETTTFQTRFSNRA